MQEIFTCFSRDVSPDAGKYFQDVRLGDFFRDLSEFCVVETDEV